MEYKTLKEAAQAELIIKRSRFIGMARPVDSEEEAVRWINELRSAHWDATHNVYAYVLRSGQIKRYSDDGEPQGTAGIPTLEVLQKGGIVDAAVVVTRYFGGVMLGAGGLVRAYGAAASAAVEKAKIITMSPHSLCALTCDYTLYNRLLPVIYQFGGAVTQSVFEGQVSLELMLPAEQENPFRTALRELSSGQVELAFLEQIFAEKQDK